MKSLLRIATAAALAAMVSASWAAETTTTATAAATEAKPTKKNAKATPEEVAAYPLKKCVVSDEDLTEHGAPIKVEAGGRTVLLCCKACKKEFASEPAKYVKKLDELTAAKAAKPEAKASN